MRMLKRLLLISFTLMMSIALSHDAYAAETGSIQLVFNNEKTTHISFSIYKIGDCIEGSLVEYVPVVEFSELDSDLNSLTTAQDCQDTIKECLSIIEKNNIQAIQTQNGDNQGNVLFHNLSTGLYLVKQDTSSEEFYSESILITLPLCKESSAEYDVVACPKYTDIKEVEETPEKPIVQSKTGDDNQILPYVVSLMVSGIAFILIYNFLKTDKKNNE